MKHIDTKLEVLYFIIFFIAVCTFILFFSPLVMLIYGHDIPVVLDGAWRMQNGQLPNVSFSSILGYSYLFQQYIFLSIFHYNMFAFAVSSVVMATISISIFLFLYKSEVFIKNSNLILRIYTFLLIIAVGLGQYNLGTPFQLLTYANLYNRYCFEALLVIILILIVLKEKNIITVKVVLCLVLIALLVNYLLFSKITFFGVGVLIIIIFSIFNYLSFNLFKYLLLISLVIFSGALLLSGENFFSILKDYKSISSVRTGLFTTVPFLLQKFKHFFNVALISCYIFLLVQLIKNKANYKVIILLLYVGIMGVLLHLTNWGETDIVFLTFIPCLFILPDFVLYRKLLSYKVLMFVSCFFICKNLFSIAKLSYVMKYKHTELKSKYLSGFYIDWVKPECNYEYSERTTSGVQLINKNIKAGEKVMSFTFENPFPLLTHTVPPKNDLLVWQYGTTYSTNIYPDANKLFRDVNLIIIPNCDDPDASLYMRKIYNKSISEHFSKIDMDNYWTLYRKK